MNKLALFVAAGATALASPPLWAQAAGAASAGQTQAAAPVNVTVGAKVSDTQGGAVGTIEAIAGDLATLNTGAHKVQLPKSSFAAGNGGLVIAMTKAQVDAAAAGAAAKSPAEIAAKLTPGAKVTGPQGGVAGTIEAVDAQFVTLSTGANKVRLPISAFAIGPNGPITSMTAAELDAAAAGAATPAGAN